MRSWLDSISHEVSTEEETIRTCVDLLKQKGGVTCSDILNLVSHGNLEATHAICVLMSASKARFPIALYKVVDLILQSDEERLVIAGLSALKGGPRGEWESLRRLLRVAETGMNTYVRSYALSEIASSGNNRCVPRVCRLLNNKNQSDLIRGAAAEALASFRDSTALATLRLALSDKSAEVRFWVCYALGQLQDEIALPDLIWHAENDLGISKQWGPVNKEAALAVKYIRQGFVADEPGELQNG